MPTPISDEGLWVIVGVQSSCLSVGLLLCRALYVHPVLCMIPVNFLIWPRNQSPLLLPEIDLQLAPLPACNNIKLSNLFPKSILPATTRCKKSFPRCPLKVSIGVILPSIMHGLAVIGESPFLGIIRRTASNSTQFLIIFELQRDATKRICIKNCNLCWSLFCFKACLYGLPHRCRFTSFTVKLPFFLPVSAFVVPLTTNGTLSLSFRVLHWYTEIPFPVILPMRGRQIRLKNM